MLVWLVSKVVSLVKDTFADTGIAILTEGVLDYKTIDEKLLIDNHYGAHTLVNVYASLGARKTLQQVVLGG